MPAAGGTGNPSIRSTRNRSSSFLDRPEFIQVARQSSPAETVDQSLYRVPRLQKPAALIELIHRGGWSQVLVFTRTKHRANRIAQKLERAGIGAAAIHGNKSQGARTRALADFKANRIRALVATDIAARGLDIDRLPHVVNFEIPNVPEDYVHRIGRTGRAGSAGHAISLIDRDEEKLLRAIEKLIQAKIREERLSGFTPDAALAEGAAQPRSGSSPAAAERGTDRPPRRRRRSPKPNKTGEASSREAGETPTARRPRRRRRRRGGRRRGRAGQGRAGQEG